MYCKFVVSAGPYSFDYGYYVRNNETEEYDYKVWWNRALLSTRLYDISWLLVTATLF